MVLSLPRDLLITRVKNELLECKKTLRHYISISDPLCSSFPLSLIVSLVNSPGPILRNGVVETKFSHTIKIIITENYPYEKPIVRWQSTIFHPNIMDVEDGGYVCTKLLREWGFHSNLVSFIKGIESLLANPNPDNPYESQCCTRAAEYFNKHCFVPEEIQSYHRKPIIISEQEGDKSED